MLQLHKSRKQLRLKGYDYGSNGAYFFTINSRNRAPFFGGIVDGIMGLSEVGCEVWKI